MEMFRGKSPGYVVNGGDGNPFAGIQRGRSPLLFARGEGEGEELIKRFQS
jgi:hypothetical protein